MTDQDAKNILDSGSHVVYAKPTIRVKQFKCGCITDKDGWKIHIFCDAHYQDMLRITEALKDTISTDFAQGDIEIVNADWLKVKQGFDSIKPLAKFIKGNWDEKVLHGVR